MPDPVSDAGPLAGICGCLQKLAPSTHLLVLAVDLPAMTAPFLQRLIDSAGPKCGVVPRIDGRFEPLAAIYPAEILPVAQRRLDNQRYRLQEFVADGIDAGLLRTLDPTPAELPLFRNLNRPDDIG